MRGVLCGLMAVVLLGGCQTLSERQRLLLADGERAYNQQRYATSVQHLSRFLAEAGQVPETARAYYVRGMSQALLGRRIEAYADLDRAARQPQDADIAWRASAAQGVLFFEDENWARAAECLGRAVATMPQVAPLDALLFRLGLCHERMGRWLDAQQPYQRIVTQFPTGRYASQAERRISLQAGHFAVQAGVFSEPSHAERVVTELRADGLPAFVRREARDGATYNVVIVGRYDSYDEATRMLARVRGYVPGAQLWP